MRNWAILTALAATIAATATKPRARPGRACYGPYGAHAACIPT